jgi:plastocyanin
MSAGASLFFAVVVACGDSGDDLAQGGAGGAGGSTGVAAPVAGANGAGGDAEEFPVCTIDDAEDRTGLAALTIITNGTLYEPRCARVSAGTEITVESDFEVHPLIGGPMVDGIGVPDPESPVPTTESGTTVTFVVPEVGDVPYFCESHFTIGMHGSLYVE